MKQYAQDSVCKVATTKTALKIEVKLKDLEALLKSSPNNNFFQKPIRVKRGQRAEFADYIARRISESEDQDTGDNPIMQMLEAAFLEIFEGDEAFCTYPEE